MARFASFDAFGTLFTFKQSVATTYGIMGAKFGYSVDHKKLQKGFMRALKLMRQKHPNFGNPPAVSATANVISTSKQWWDEVVDLSFQSQEIKTVKPSLKSALYNFYQSNDAYTVYDDVVPFLEALQHRGVVMCVTSNFDERLESLVTDLGLAKYFHFILDSRTQAAEKPQLFHRLLQETSALGFKKEELIHIGDDEIVDIDGAKSFGIKSILIDRLAEHPDKQELVNDLSKCLDLFQLKK